MKELLPESKLLLKKLFKKYLENDRNKKVIFKHLPENKQERLLELLTLCKGVVPYEKILKKDSLLQNDDAYTVEDFRSRLKGGVQN